MQQSIVSLTLDWYHLVVAYNLGVRNGDLVGLGYGYLKMVVVSIPFGSTYHALEIALVTIGFGIVHVVNLGVQNILTY